MDRTESPLDQVFRHHFTVPDSAVDQNGHVNNVVYIQWMQDVATMHFDAVGGTALMQEAAATWVVRSHNIEYLSPLFAGEEVTVLTWVVNFRRVRSLRRYRFLRTADGVLLAKGETDWVFVDNASGRPCRIPDGITGLLPLLEDI
jgi:acyl-CoA thioester hydrolase